MTAAEIDIRHMTRALELAAQGEGLVEPNPMVGCVVAHGPQIVGEGWHGGFGGPHAEVKALGEAGDKARGATLFVTLEPCCHQGKTPPARSWSSTAVFAVWWSPCRTHFLRSAARGLPGFARLASALTLACWQTKPAA